MVKQYKLKVAIDTNVDIKLIRPLQEQGRIVIVKYQVEQIPGNIKVQLQGQAFRAGISSIGGRDKIVTQNNIDIYSQIVKIIGKSNQVDCDHVYSAYLNCCDFFITEDKDILTHKDKLESLLGYKIENGEELIKILT